MNNKNKNRYNNRRNRKNFYLIDYENVGVKGLEGAENLNSNDYIHLFSTKNAPKITTATLSTFNSTNFKVHEVPVKNQSVDMHLVSYLGFLIGTYRATSHYTIISKDSDYQNIVKYWKNEINITVKYQENLISKETEISDSDTEKKTKYEGKPKYVNSSIPNSKNKELNNIKVIIRNELKEFGYSYNVINTVIKIVSSNYFKGNFLVNVQNELQKSVDDFKTIYDIVEFVFTSHSYNSSKPHLQKSKSFSSTSSNSHSFQPKSYSQANSSSRPPQSNSKPLPPKPISSQPKVIKTDFLFQENAWLLPELYVEFNEAVMKEMKFYGYSDYEITLVVNNLVNVENADKFKYFQNLRKFLMENFETTKACEIFNIVKAIVLGDLNYPGVVSMTLSNGEYFTKRSPTLELQSVFTILQENLKDKLNYETVDTISAIVLRNYSENDNRQKIYKEIISVFGENKGLNIYNIIKDILYFIFIINVIKRISK